jgi:hypothetical protein
MQWVVLAAILLAQSMQEQGERKDSHELRRLCFVDPAELGKPPVPVQSPAGLPEAMQVDGGTLLPAPLDDEVGRKLTCLGYWPSACSASLESQRWYYELRISGEQKMQRALVEQLTTHDDGGGVRPWMYGLIGAMCGVVIGAGAGLIVGFVAGSAR